VQTDFTSSNAASLEEDICRAIEATTLLSGAAVVINGTKRT
jgi:hypothetical protein